MRGTHTLLALLLTVLSRDHVAQAVPDAHSLVGNALPFAAQAHRFQLSDTLFAANEPVHDAMDAAAHSSNATTKSPMRLADVPFPTGAFWTNLVLDKGESVVTTMPYAFRLLRGDVHISYPFRVVMPTIIQNGFLSELVLSSAGTTDDATAPLTHQVVAFDAFSASVRFTRQSKHEFTLLLVRGSPYVTAEFMQSVPILKSDSAIRVLQLQKRLDATFENGDAVDFSVFLLMLSNGQSWSVYASDPALELVLDAATGVVQATAAFTGTLRMALCLDASVQPLLLESAPFYPVGGAIDYQVDTASDTAHLTLKWHTRQFTNATSTAHSKTNSSSRRELLMMALPHHMEVLGDSNALALDTLRFTSIKGMMRGVYGAKWHMVEPLAPVEWEFEATGLYADDKDDKNAAKRHAMRQEVDAAIVAQLARDVVSGPVALARDAYNFGKQIGREARLLLLADRFDQPAIVKTQLAKLKRELEPWLTGTNVDALVYDETFGGVVTHDGMLDAGADYGNGQYNDHHFHYGYMIYALAVVRKFDPAFIASHALACALVMGDIGAPVLSSTPFALRDADVNLPLAQLFPVARHKDWFVGHSYASGLFSMEVGKSQESSSESVNAYYALALFASLEADAKTTSDSFYQYARLLLATEVRASKLYWHMAPNSLLYEPTFAANAMVGVAGEMSVVYSTWFGNEAVYVHGINMIPFTPVTPQLLPVDYVKTEYSVLAPDLAKLPPNDIWRSVIVLDHAVLDAHAAWQELTASITAYDTWNSASNAMFWIATRPTWFDKAVVIDKDANNNASNQCFGFPACSVAGANNTALGCCDTLAGCCPSALACCPQPKLASIPATACFAEPQCALLGLSCCNTIDGCCVPDPFTGGMLGCCKDQSHSVRSPRTKPLATKPADSSSSNRTAPTLTGACFGEPKCAAAGLDCCAGPTGCCSSVDGSAKLDCCSQPTLSPIEQHVHDTSAATCHHQPQCAAAKLDCCSSAQGCCAPDPLTGNKLLCCQDDASAVEEGDDKTSAPPASPSPAPTPTSTPVLPPSMQTCHGAIACLTGGTNGTALDCCFTDKGCCPGLLCCDRTADDGDVNRGVHRAKTATGDQEDDDSDDRMNGKSNVNIVLVIVLGVVVVLTIAFCLAMCYRRRHYASIGPDLRAWYCAGLMLVVAGFFVFLVANA